MTNGTTRREMMQRSLALAGVGVFGAPEWALPALAQDEVRLPFTDIPEDFGQPAPGSSIPGVRHPQHRWAVHPEG